MRCLGLDIGSTSIKGAVLDLDSNTVRNILREPFPDPTPGLPAGFHEVSPDRILAAARGVIEQLSSQADDATHLYCSGQMGGILLLDSGLRPLTRYLSWRDQRTTMAAGGRPMLERLRGVWTDEQFSELGKELKPGSATSLLCWLREHATLPAGAIPVTVGDYVVSALCGSEPRMDRTQTIGMLNLKTGDWHRTALAAAGLDELQWPPLAATAEPVGELTIAGRRLSCFPVIGDQQAALRGIDLQPEELSINCSTGAQVSQITPDFRPADCQSRSWFHGHFLNTITHIPAGRSLSVLESLLTELARASGVRLHDSWRLIGEAAERSAGDGLRCDLSFFASATGSDGRIEGITTENLTVGNLFQAAFEFMADAFLSCSRRLSPHPAWSRLAVSGGLVQSFPALRKKLESRFPWPVREVAEQEETLMGLLRLAQETAGKHGSNDIGR